MAHVMDNYFDEIVSSTVKIVKFDSSLKPAAGENGEYPFGKETADCLQFFLDLAKGFGFETHNYDNYVGEVVFGKGEEFAVLAHLDVVPAGNGWKYPPFGGVINDDLSDGGVGGKKIWGRGTLDDKTPAIICLYALKALKDSGFFPRRKIKLIVGCNEECGWQCIEHYNKVAKMPEEGFTPDADFPVIYAEKGILHFTLSFPIENSPAAALQAGERVNMVCDLAQALLTKKAGGKLVYYENKVIGTSFSYDNTTNILRVHGKSAHGSTPDKGANALGSLLAFLGSFHEDFQKAYDVLFNDSLGLKTLHDETGHLTFSPNVASLSGGVLKVTSDVRFPATMQLEEITQKLDSLGLEYAIESYKEPLYNNPKGALISTLCKVFEKTTGRSASPLAIGGGTYARALKCGCGFGPYLPETEDVIHQPNEYITFSHIKQLGEIYFEAIKEIAKPNYTRIGWVKVKK